MLTASIERRERLLANDNYVDKAPAKIVELDRQKLAEEKQKLTELYKYFFFVNTNYGDFYERNNKYNFKNYLHINITFLSI